MGRSGSPTTAARAVFLEAIRRARERGHGAAIDGVRRARRDTGGSSRQRFRAWTLAERPARSPRPRSRGNPVEVAEEAIFGRYRGLLEAARRRGRGGDGRLGLEAAGPQSPVLGRDRGFGRRSSSSISTIPTPAHCGSSSGHSRPGRPVHVALAYDPDPALAEVYHATDGRPDAPARDWGFSRRRRDRGRAARGPARGRAMALFREPGRRPSRRSPTATGLAIRGAPQGEGVARILAREVRALAGAGSAARGDPDRLSPLERRGRAGPRDAAGLGIAGARRRAQAAPGRAGRLGLAARGLDPAGRTGRPS